MNSPLADRLRPEELSEVAGQKHLLGEDKILKKIIETGDIPNLIFYGPSGVGKTTVAKIIAKKCGKKLCYLNATTASTADIKQVVEEIGSLAAVNGILLYLDEIQYFNKKQQQILLSYIENGDITLIASTTENPYFYVYNAILSRSTVFEFKTLSADDITEVINRALGILSEEAGKKITAESGDIRKIALAAAGDVRRALNMLELCFMLSDKTGKIESEMVEQILSGNAVRYDREGDEHYDLVSAYQKSLRGSDVDAALYYLARLLAAGDLPSACRRLLVCANEDVGLAYPQIIPIVYAAVQTAEKLGMPEARIPLANAVTLVASSPKSNSVYNAINTAMADIERGGVFPVPRQLQNKHCDGADNENPGQNYLYPHDFENHYVVQQYLPTEIKDRRYYRAGDNKSEQQFAAYLDKIKNK